MATLRDVAKLAGVAPITASRVLSGSGYASAETRARVEAAAAALNYVPNMLAHSLRSNRTQTIALVLTDITNPFWTAVARAVEDEAHANGYSVIFCNTDENEDKQRHYVSMLLRRRVDGVLLVPASNSNHSVVALKGQGVKVVILDRALPGEVADVVRSDSFGGAQMLAAHLLSRGHRRIAILSGPADISVTQERVAGFCERLRAVGIELDEQLTLYGHFTFASGYAMTQTILARRPWPTALFAGNNFIALGALRALYDAGLRVPADMSLVTFDDLPFTEMPEALLTTAAQETHILGQIAVQRLLARVTEVEPQPISELVLPTRLIVRSSVAHIGPAVEA